MTGIFRGSKYRRFVTFYISALEILLLTYLLMTNLWRRGGQDTNLESCLHYYAYRIMIAVKTVLIDFFLGGENKFGEGTAAP